MFGDAKQLELYRALMNPGAISNPTTGAHTELVTQAAVIRGEMDNILETVRDNCPGHLPPAPPGSEVTDLPCDCDDVLAMEALSGEIDAILSTTNSAGSAMHSHAGSMTGSLGENVGRFDVALKVQRIASPNTESSPCTDALTAMASISGIGTDKMSLLVLAGGAVLYGLGKVLGIDGSVDYDALNDVRGKMGDWGDEADKLRGILDAEKAAQSALDNVLKDFGMSNMLGGWFNDDCLSVVVDNVASDEIKDILNS